MDTHAMKKIQQDMGKTESGDNKTESDNRYLGKATVRRKMYELRPGR